MKDSKAEARPEALERAWPGGGGTGGWMLVSDECLPPAEIPVWLYLPELRQPIIGCRTEEGGEWFWARCYGDFWFDGHWKTDTADMDDLKPSHWMALPDPPRREGENTSDTQDVDDAELYYDGPTGFVDIEIARTVARERNRHRSIIAGCLKVLPVGWLGSHTADNLPDMIGHWVSEAGRLENQSDQLREALENILRWEPRPSVAGGPGTEDRFGGDIEKARKTLSETR